MSEFVINISIFLPTNIDIVNGMGECLLLFIAVIETGNCSHAMDME
jgi:hypothetical protein